MTTIKVSAVLLLVYLCRSQGSFCSFGNQPVCGVDYITYPNQCALQVAGVNLKHYGECTQVMTADGNLVMNCPKTYSPVCGVDLITYANECRLQAKKVRKAFNGPCDAKPSYVPPVDPRACDCTGEDSPICSLGGVTFENQCVLNCSQQIAMNFGSCSTQCNCERRYDPVCGIDGRTYDNICLLNCVRIGKYGLGECSNLIQSCDYCSLVPLNVCGEDSKTYLNLCTLRCKGVKLQYFGQCKSTPNPGNTCSQCTDLYHPICGTDGKNYQNECLCTCQANCRKYSDGYCPDPNSYRCQQCVGVISKVCGKDGRTYDNYCFMQCEGADLMYHGPCAEAKKDKHKKQEWMYEKRTYVGDSYNM